MPKPAAMDAICRLVVRPKLSRMAVSVPAPRESSLTMMFMPSTWRRPIMMGWKVVYRPPVAV